MGLDVCHNISYTYYLIIQFADFQNVLDFEV